MTSTTTAATVFVVIFAMMAQQCHSSTSRHSLISTWLSLDASNEYMHGVRATPANITYNALHPSQRCSDQCQCTTAGLLPYGRYCGLWYTGCPGALPCDNVDACCLAHDACVGENGYTDCECTVAVTKCLVCAISNGASSPQAPWSCKYHMDAARRMVADVKLLLPHCYRRAKQEVVFF